MYFLLYATIGPLIEQQKQSRQAERACKAATATVMVACDVSMDP